MKIGAAIQTAVQTVTKDWTTYKKKTFRDARRGQRALERMYVGRTRQESLREIVWRLMKRAYLAASANGTLPASARQIFYQARPLVAAETEKPLDDNYFTQTLLPDYLDEHNVTWDVVFDARGHLWEPHTDHEIQLTPSLT